jgi:hypothetical protein
MRFQRQHYQAVLNVFINVGRLDAKPPSP